MEKIFQGNGHDQENVKTQGNLRHRGPGCAVRGAGVRLDGMEAADGYAAGGPCLPGGAREGKGSGENLYTGKGRTCQVIHNECWQLLCTGRSAQEQLPGKIQACRSTGGRGRTHPSIRCRNSRIVRNGWGSRRARPANAAEKKRSSVTA